MINPRPPTIYSRWHSLHRRDTTRAPPTHKIPSNTLLPPTNRPLSAQCAAIASVWASRDIPFEHVSSTNIWATRISTYMVGAHLAESKLSARQVSASHNIYFFTSHTFALCATNAMKLIASHLWRSGAHMCNSSVRHNEHISHSQRTHTHIYSPTLWCAMCWRARWVCRWKFAWIKHKARWAVVMYVYARRQSSRLCVSAKLLLTKIYILVYIYIYHTNMSRKFVFLCFV